MKKILSILVISIALASCSNGDGPPVKQQPAKQVIVKDTAIKKK